jgi:hypothetical protein
MSRLLTSGFEESLAQSDLTLTMWDAAAGTITITVPPITRGQSQTCAQFTTNVEGHVTKSLTTAVATGSLYTRVYAMWGDFGSAPNAQGTLFMWVNGSGVEGIAVKFNPSTKVFRLSNSASGSPATADGTFVASVNTWIRLELEIIVASTTAGSTTLKIYVGDNTTPVDTITLAAQATAGTGTIATLAGVQIGNRTGSDWGTMSIDDIGINDADTTSGDGQTTWCGAGSIFLINPSLSNTKPMQWIPFGASAGSDVARPNSMRPNMSFPNGPKVSNIIVNNYGNLFDEPGAPDDSAHYNYTFDTVSADRFDIVPAPSSLPDATAFKLIDVYARVGGASTSTVTLCLTIWDNGGFQNDGPAVFITINGWQRTRSGEHNASTLSGVTKTQLNQFSIGYKSLSGSGLERRVTALWANVEYTPDLSTVVSRALTHNYAAQSAVAQVGNHNCSALKALAVALLSNYTAQISAARALGTPWDSRGFLAVTRALTHVYEALKSVTQSY